MNLSDKVTLNSELTKLVGVEDCTIEELIVKMYLSGVPSGVIKYAVKLSDFTTPVYVSDEFADFCGVNNGTMMSRHYMNEQISQYIKDNNLNDGKLIHADEKLTNLLKQNAQLTWFNIQKYIGEHVMH